MLELQLEVNICRNGTCQFFIQESKKNEVKERKINHVCTNLQKYYSISKAEKHFK